MKGYAGRFTTRKEIRDKVIALLQNGNIKEVGDNVFSGPINPASLEELPALAVYHRDEDYTTLRKAVNAVRRDLTLVVEIYAGEQNESELLDMLDAIADQVENILIGSDALDETVHDIGLDSALLKLSDQIADRPFGVWAITFNVGYLKKF